VIACAGTAKDRRDLTGSRRLPRGCGGRRPFFMGARAAQRAGADIDAAAVQSHHRYFEAVTFRSEPVRNRHPAVLEDHRRGRLAVPAEFAFLRPETQSRRAVFNDETGDAARSGLAGAHHADIDIRASTARDEGLAAVQHVMVASVGGATWLPRPVFVGFGE